MAKSAVKKFGVVTGGRRSGGTALKTAADPSLAEPLLVAEPQQAETTQAKDYFVERNGVKFAGTHLLVELWGARNLGDLAITDQMLRDATTAAGATLLHVHLHHFGPGAGLSGVAVLAESHISIHTWPERGYAAIDVFMCGACDPYKAVPVMKRAFEPTTVQLSEQKRGVIA
jgi:S-adenosylmethionine decarboxylase